MTQFIPDKKWLFESIEQGDGVDGIPPLICTLLAQREVRGKNAVDKFLNPSLDQLPDPIAMAGLAESVAILEKGIIEKNKVLIYGDYDADGITATALLFSFFKEIGLDCTHYIPDRLTEGYGLSATSLRQIRESAELIDYPEPILITVDCGISSHAEVAEARGLGFKVIITDHHLPPDELPEADAIVNPNQGDCLFSDKNLSGVGVAFYVLIGLRSRLTKMAYWSAKKQPNLKKYLDLVAIGTIADLVPLSGANRILVKAGLEVIQSTPRPGIKAIMENAGISEKSITASQIAFQVAPRINAAGRVAKADLALEVLLAENRNEAVEPAKRLEIANNYRKELSESIFVEACLQAESQLEQGVNGLVLVDETWHLGVLGLIASRIAERYYRPTVALSTDGKGITKGSARSVGELNLFEIMKECSGHLEKFGGHKAAAGLTIRHYQIADFTAKFKESVNRKIADINLQPIIYVNLKASLSELMDDNFLVNFEKLEPFGNGNPEPVFCSKDDNLSLSEPRKVGRDSLRFKVAINKNAIINGIGFGMAGLMANVKDVPVKIAFKIFKNEFRGRTNWEIRAEDIKVNTN